MGRVQVCHRLPWTWSSCSISHMPLNVHVDHDTLKVLEAKKQKHSCSFRQDACSQLEQQPPTEEEKHFHPEVCDLEGSMIGWWSSVKKPLYFWVFHVHQSCFNTRSQTLNKKYDNMTKSNQTIQSAFLCSAFQTPCWPPSVWSTSVNVSYRHYGNGSHYFYIKSRDINERRHVIRCYYRATWHT